MTPQEKLEATIEELTGLKMSFYYEGLTGLMFWCYIVEPDIEAAKKADHEPVQEFYTRRLQKLIDSYNEYKKRKGE
jgi:hypothetical protein